jgi:hypothetical protein
MNRLNTNTIRNFKKFLPLSLLHYYRVDCWIGLGLAVAIAIATFIGTYQIPAPIFTDFYAQDVWFGSDIPTVFGNISSTNSDFGRNNKHPLFPLLVFPFVFGFSKLFRLDLLTSARLVSVGVAMLWIASLYTLFRVMGCRRLDAVILSLVGGVSAASLFWLVIPESFSFGSLTIILGLIFVVVTQFRQISWPWYLAINVVTVSITITNWMVGLLATLVNHRLFKTIQLAVGSILLTTGLWILQRIVFTNSGFPFQPGTFIGEKKFISAPSDGGIPAFVAAFFYKTVVMPAIQLVDSPIRPDWIKLETNPLSPGSGGLWGTTAVIAWTGLIGLGIWAFFVHRQQSKLRLVLGATLLLQFLMHSIYGVEETFIYALHFVPLLLTLVAFSLLTRLRWLSLGLAIVFIVSAGFNNKAQFNQVTASLWNYGTPQQRVLAQMALRPSDPWPRSAGHAILASPNSDAQDKAFHEPGGSFSPQPGSFGVSIWVVDGQGNLKATSDSMPLKEIQQRFIGLESTSLGSATVPSILTKTPYYEASWNIVRDGAWKLDLKSIQPNIRLVVVIRSVGPAGGALSSLNWNGQRIRVGDRWVVQNLPRSAKVYLGSESTPGWQRNSNAQSHWEDSQGWWYARIEPNSKEPWSLQIRENQPTVTPKKIAGSSATSLAPASPSKISNIFPKNTFTPKNPTTLNLNLPDPEFVNSLNAQIAHLKMGLVNDRTIPTDPISHPLPRLRDGAYQLVALARAGQLDLAQQLTPYFAETDFLNSTVPEADIPALGIWALEEVAIALQNRDFDRWLWPHIQRKAKLIEDLMSRNRPGYPVLEGAKQPFSEQPDLIRVDLIAGKMDNTPSSISLNPGANPISYRALKDAAAHAQRLGQTNSASHWMAQAETIRTAWQKNNQKTKTPDFSNSLWPTWIADPDTTDTLAQNLGQKWDKFSNNKGTLQDIPLTLQSNLSEAHQWILLNQPERVWPMLQWFWANQASPGLYTWSAAPGTLGQNPLPKSFSHWQRIRGWVNPVQPWTPHYWTTAEMALLQLDMLAYVHHPSGTLVIGAGVPKEWLDKTMTVKGMSIQGQPISWSWDRKQITVQLQKQRQNLLLGTAFPKNTPIKVTVLQKG